MHDELLKDSFQTVISEASSELKVLNSRFIASAFHVDTSEEAMDILTRIKKKYYDAAHNCFAYRIGVEGNDFRYSDDGEPSGTAGIKILTAIKSQNLTNILIVVTRYFGGTKLGIGRLSNAYFDAAVEVLKKLKSIRKFIGKDINLTFPYGFTSQIMYIISKYNAKVVDSIYEEDVKIIIELRLSEIEKFQTEVINACSGNVIIKTGEENIIY